MKISSKILSLPTLISICTLSTLVGCAGLDYPSSSNRSNDRYRGSSYGGGYSGSDDYYHRREIERLEEERDEAEEEREEAERDRRRLERELREKDRERERESEEKAHRAPPPPPVEHCPSGFSETDSKCSDKQRKKGCKDIKMPGGKRCIKY